MTTPVVEVRGLRKILRGGVTQEQVVQILIGQTVWLGITFVAFQWIWRRGVRAYSAVGA